MDNTTARAVAFYLPQYFPIPENDAWWGPGFTEWTNVARARRLYPGHKQPNLPADLGFYDLRVEETRELQSALAQEHGIEAFAYWHYWFGGGLRILERPFQEVLQSGKPNFKFCLAWANQTWTGIWHGAKDRVLRQQSYLGEEDDRAHFNTILPAFKDPRYLTVHGKPLFYVFRPEELPNARQFIDRWQGMAQAAGLPGLYLVAEVSDLLGKGPRYSTVLKDGFDAGVYMQLPAKKGRLEILRMRTIRKVLGGPEVFPYGTIDTRRFLNETHLQPCIYPNWDNTPRSGRGGLVLQGATPNRFEENVRAAVRSVAGRDVEERFIWIKSWNEWAEGNHLEPDLVNGRGWLNALKGGLGD